MLSGTYYAQNYASIIGRSLSVTQIVRSLRSYPNIMKIPIHSLIGCDACIYSEEVSVETIVTPCICHCNE